MLSIQLTHREEELMNDLWTSNEPMTSNDMLEKCTGRTWSDSYLHVMLRSLLKKGMIEQCGLVQYTTQYARLFRPTMTKEEYYVRLAYERRVDPALYISYAMKTTSSVVRESNAALADLLDSAVEQMN